MFHPDLRLLRSFAAIAEEASVTRAAERLHLTQPTVSGQIKELEQDLGFALFHRTTRSVTLTADGDRLLPIVRTILDRAETLRTEVETMQVARASHFRLGGAMYSMDFADRIALLDAFDAAHPAIRFTIDNRLQSSQLPDLMGERLDAAFLLGIPVQTLDQADPRDGNPGRIINETQYPDSLERVVLCARKIGLLVPQDSPLAAFATIPRNALAGREVAMLSGEHGHAFVDPIAGFLRENGATPIIPSEGNALAIERHAERHAMCAIGIGWFPVLPGLTYRPVEGMNFHMELAVVLGTGANAAARKFFAFAREWQAARSELPAQIAA
jgi:DNA-binding transcriptional LysR family regulator